MATDLLAEKIPDSTLREHALASSDEPVSVIIELAVLDPKVEYRHVERDGEDTTVPVRVEPESSKEREELEDVATNARTFLDKLLVEPPVYLRAARSFVATATGSQLEEIARSPFTKRIEPNRTLPPPHAQVSTT